MTEPNGLTTKQLLERMDRRDERMERWIQEQRKTNQILAEGQIAIARLLDRMDDGVARPESR